MNISCSFFGHRNATITNVLKQKLIEIIEDLIVNHNVSTFLFGSRSEFNDLCHLIVTQLQSKYANLKRVAYTCRNETCILERDRKKWEDIYSKLKNQDVYLLAVEEEYEHNTKYSSGKACYVQRNQAMINNSNYCIFYYNEKYLPSLRKLSKQNLTSYQPKSGTALAYSYAKRKNKVVINIL